MHKLLQDLLLKRGIKSLDELNDEEKSQYNAWNETLTKESLNLEDIKRFCQTQCDTINNRWGEYGLEQAKKAELLPYFTTYTAILKAIDSPKDARKATENLILQLIK